MKKNDINISEDVEFNTNASNKTGNKETKKYIYKCIFFCPIIKLDCVNSMDIYDDLLVYGTIMGNVKLCHIDKNYLYPKKRHKLLFKEEEDKKSNISDKITEKKTNDKNDNNIIPLTLKKYKENIYINDDDNVDSHYNLTYSNINNINNEIDNNEKNSNKINLIKTRKIYINNKNKEKEEIIFTNKIEPIIPLIPYPQITTLITGANENISCVVFETKDIVIISVGDEELIRMENISTLNTNDPNSKFYYSRAKNYERGHSHLMNCENTITFLTPENYLLLNMFIGDFNSKGIRREYINYINKNIKAFQKPENIEGTIDSYNFVIPFDFDGSQFLYLEHVEINLRKICIYHTINNALILEHEIDNNFGHVSFMKFVFDDTIFLVRKNNICEIYQIKDDLTLMERWNHIGEEIISVEVYIEGTKISEDFMVNINDKENNGSNKGSNNVSFKVNEKEDEKIINIRFSNVNQYNSSPRELNKRHNKELSNDKLNKNDIDIYNKYNNKKVKEEILDLNIYKKYGNNKKINKKSQKGFSVATLDINGNFNLYKNKENILLFNLYEIEGIEQKYKDEEFFFLGFPYYISMNSKYICISTDQGIFVVKKFNL